MPALALKIHVFGAPFLVSVLMVYGKAARFKFCMAYLRQGTDKRRASAPVLLLR